MDALPVTEEVDLPFASKVRATYDGKEVGVMHACGHDAHVAILLGVAHVLSQLKAGLPGTVKFLFQPAEEGPPAGEEGGARLMIKEGVLAGEPKPAAIFGLHVTPNFTVGQIGWRAGGLLAGADGLRITVHGRQTHAGYPWRGIDPIVAAAPSLGGEDFSYYQRQIPGFFFWLGIRTAGADPALFAQNHSPRFRIDEAGLALGVRALAHLAVDYLQQGH